MIIQYRPKMEIPIYRGNGLPTKEKDSRMIKINYLYTLSLILSFSLGIYYLFFESIPVTPNHVELSLVPNTAREQNDLILAQEQTQEELPVQTGPLVAQMSASDAQTKVLNLKK